MIEQPEQPEAKPKPDPRALNAYRHGLTGQVHIGTEAEQDAYDIHCKNIHEALAPVGAMEIEIAQDIADDRWRLKRGRAIESTGYAIGIAMETGNFSPNNHPEAAAAFAMAAKWFNDAKSIALLGLYIHRIERGVEKSLKLLKQLQAERQAALQKAAEESNLLAELAESKGESKGESYNPVNDFPRQTLPLQFVFSNQEIAALATHLRCLVKAKNHLEARQNFARKAA